MSSKIEQMIDQIEDFIDSCRYQTFSKTNIIVDKDEMDALLEELRAKTPDEIRHYQRIIANKEAILDDAKRKAEEAQRREAKATPKATTQQTKEDEVRQEPHNEVSTQTPDIQSSQASVQELPQQTNQNGWSGLLSSFGLNGISDIGNNLGYVLAMLPDMLVGAFTGKTKSLGLKENLMPLASIVAGMFVRNPILKMVLVGMGGLNILNKAGHEAIGNHAGQNQAQGASTIVRSNYKVYADESLNQRISQPQIRGNCLIATIDKVPCTIALPDKVVDAYNQGALPLNTLANAVLAKNDQMRQLASENYEAQQRTETRTLAQR